ncbi:hypothetical protein FDO65_18790 [Nakamurella flava]|uniref:Uncharacterized protein n=1 Tax=Nakamurella flava TaxID=2576308 RepID=A0A4U6QAE7_9ACTN|nr:hypothetical protein [Nakamurella flava]TKV56888.1 hypothetical protein FDO65_18790 [Nakamurella flava]
MAVEPDPGQPGNDAESNDSWVQFVLALGEDGVRNQRDQRDFADWIEALPGIGQTGYYQPRSDHRRRHLTIQWYGDPDGQAAIVSEGRRRGLSVEFVPIAFPKSRYEEFVQWMTHPSSRDALGFTVHSISGPTFDEPFVVLGGEVEQFTEEALRAVGEELSRLVGIHVVIRPGLPFRPWGQPETSPSPTTGLRSQPPGSPRRPGPHHPR